MKYFFSGMGVKTFPKASEYLLNNNGCILLSQLNDRGKIKQYIEEKKKGKHFELMIDSGAFSAWTIGKKIDVEKYITFLNENHMYFDIFVGVDVIPGEAKSKKVASSEEVEASAQLTWENYLYMREKLVDPTKLMYTYHIGEPISYLQRALDFEDSHGKILYLGLGAMVGKADRQMISFYEEVFNLIKQSKNPDIKVHAFGMTQFKIMEKFPEFYSVDSTTAIQAAMRRKIYLDGKIYTCTEREGSLDSIFYLPDMIKEKIQSKLDTDFGGTKLEDLPFNQPERVYVNVVDMFNQVKNLNFKKVSKTISLW